MADAWPSTVFFIDGERDRIGKCCPTMMCLINEIDPIPSRFDSVDALSGWGIDEKEAQDRPKNVDETVRSQVCHGRNATSVFQFQEKKSTVRNGLGQFCSIQRNDVRDVLVAMKLVWRGSFNSRKKKKIYRI